MKPLIALLGVFAAGLCLTMPTARADIGGTVPGPGLCDYPGIGGSGAQFGAYDYACAFPTEINGSHWQCLYGGAMWQGTVGVGILMFNASITTPVGVLRGACYWACPDLSLAEAPNPPGAWKNYIGPTKCKSVGPNPMAPPPEPQPVGAPEPETPAVTNPENPNPDATVNPR